MSCNSTLLYFYVRIVLGDDSAERCDAQHLLGWQGLCFRVGLLGFTAFNPAYRCCSVAGAEPTGGRGYSGLVQKTLTALECPYMSLSCLPEVAGVL